MKLRPLLLCLAFLPQVALAANGPSGSQRVQGVPDGFGDPVQVTLVAADGSSVEATAWAYPAAAGGITNTTTAVTIKAATAAERNYVTSIQIESDALGAATELAIRDGAGGTVLWRTKIGTGGVTEGIAIEFPTPLKGSVNTLLEVVTLTASVTGSVYFNAQGYTAP